jgi:hypothetical protein
MDNNFIRLFNTFDRAKGGNPNITNLAYQGFIMQLPNETFLQQTSLTSGIAFSGAIQVDLIDNCGNVKKNIDSNFYYESFIDDNGTPQITFEFGMINENFYTTPLYLKITDLVNGAIWYSNDFLVTDYDVNLSARFDYGNVNSYLQSVRFSKMYDFNPVNENSVKQYTTTQGLRVNSKSITTYLRQYKCDAINYDINDRLNELFASEIVFLNGQGVVISDFKSNERKGTTNFLDAEFVVNPQNEMYQWQLQIYPKLEIIDLYPLNGSVFTKANFDSTIALVNYYINFNQDFNPLKQYIQLRSNVGDNIGKLYKDNVYFCEISQLDTYTNFIQIVFNNEDLTDFTNGEYRIEVNPINELGVGQDWNGISDWTFTIADGEYDNTEYNNEYLTN